MSSVVFQEPVVDRSLTGRRNLEIHGRLWGVEPREAAARIDELAGTFGLADLIDRPADTFSGGQRRRLEIARALVSHPRVLFLDEPTVGLDPAFRAELLEVIAEHAKPYRADRPDDDPLPRGGGATLRSRRESSTPAGSSRSTHPRPCSRASAGSCVELRVDGSVNSALARCASGASPAKTHSPSARRVTVPLHRHSSGDAIAAIHDLGLAGAISAREPTLDDVYLRLTGDSLAAAA